MELNEMRIMFLSKIRLCVRENPLVNWACAVLVDNDMVQSCVFEDDEERE